MVKFLIIQSQTIQTNTTQTRLLSILPRHSGVLLKQQATLLDGEMVQDVLGDGSKRICFLVYDAICINRETKIAKFNLMERLRLALTEVVQPR